MTKEHKDTQADRLQQLFSEISQNEPDEEASEAEVVEEQTENAEKNIDILNLPPRSDVHISKGRWIKITFRRPLIRFLFITLILILIIIGIYCINGFYYFF